MDNTEISNAPTSAELDEMLDIQHAEVIQTVIGSLDPNHTAMVSKGDGGHIWKFTYGSIEVFVQLTGNTDDDVLTVWSKVMALPVKNLGLQFSITRSSVCLPAPWRNCLLAKYPVPLLWWLMSPTTMTKFCKLLIQQPNSLLCDLKIHE
jgi:hypothetical protein